MKHHFKELLTLAGEMVQVAVKDGPWQTLGAVSETVDLETAPERPLRLLFKPETWFSKQYRVERPGGRSVGMLDLGAWKTWGEISFPGGSHSIRRDPRDGAFVLYHDGEPEAQAVREGLLQKRYVLEWRGGRGVLKAQRRESNVYVLETGEGHEVARLARAGWTARQVAATFPSNWPLERALFVATLVILTWITQESGVVVVVK